MKHFLFKRKTFFCDQKFKVFFTDLKNQMFALRSFLVKSRCWYLKKNGFLPSINVLMSEWSSDKVLKNSKCSLGVRIFEKCEIFIYDGFDLIFWCYFHYLIDVVSIFFIFTTLLCKFSVWVEKSLKWLVVLE